MQGEPPAGEEGGSEGAVGLTRETPATTVYSGRWPANPASLT